MISVVKANAMKVDDRWKILGWIGVLVFMFFAGSKMVSRPEPEKKIETPNIVMPIPEEYKKESQRFFNLDRQWLQMKSDELGISFLYPIPAGEVTFGYADYPDRDNDPAGQMYGWNIKVDDGTKYGYTYTFVGGVSEAFKAGRERWFTDFYKIEPGDYNNPKKIFKTKYGTDAIWSDSPFIRMGETEADPKDMGTILKIDLPITKDPRFKGIAIYFRDRVSIEDAERVVESLSIE